jgi:hypothetical protein
LILIYYFAGEVPSRQNWRTIIMMHRKLIMLLILCTFALTASDESVETRLVQVAGIKVNEMQHFLTNLKLAVRNDNKDAIGKLVQYPLTLRAGSRRSRITGPDEFAARYNLAMPEKVKKAVLDQRFDGLFVNARGAMFGKGELWVSNVCVDEQCRDKNLRIIAINP